MEIMFNGKVIGGCIANHNITFYQAVALAFGVNYDEMENQESQERLETLYRNGNKAIYIDDDYKYCIDFDNITIID